MRDLQFDDMHLFARGAEPGTLSPLARIDKACIDDRARRSGKAR